MLGLRRYGGPSKGWEDLAAYNLVPTAKNLGNNGDTILSNAQILANTSNGAFGLYLPTSPTVGSTVQILDTNNTFATYNLTLYRNGSPINGLAEDLTCDIAGAKVDLIYKGSSIGWQIDVGTVGYAPVMQTKIVDLTNLTSDYPLQIGETGFVTLSGATTVPLHVACVEGVYEMDLLCDASNTNYPTNTTTLNMNNTTYAGVFSFCELGYEVSFSQAGTGPAPGGWKAGDHSNFQLGYMQIVAGHYTLITKTGAKALFGRQIRKSSATIYTHQWSSACCEDYTTAWTSLGTVVFPVAHTGKIIVRRVA